VILLELSTGDEVIDEWLYKNSVVVGIIVATIGSKAFKDGLAKKGLTPLMIAAGVLSGYVGVQAVGLAIAYSINDETGVTDWMYASNKMFGWYGLEQGNLAFLNVLPNPLGIIDTLWESGKLIGEATYTPVVMVIEQIANTVIDIVEDVLDFVLDIGPLSLYQP
jgi:hypothetical protein